MTDQISISYFLGPIRRISLTFFAVITLCTCLIAQPGQNAWGVGIQLGQPSGISIKNYNQGGMSADILLAWDLNDFFFVNLHGTWEKPVNSVNDLQFVYGPGFFVGFEERSRFKNSDDEIFLGISGTFGLSYFIDRFEIYLRLTPRLAVIESTNGDIGGGLGFRFFF